MSGTPSFREFYLKDINPLGGTNKLRLCNRQNKAMKILQKRLSEYIRSRQIDLPFSTAFKKGNSSLKNIEKHRKKRYFYLTDIKHAFQSVDEKKLAAILYGICQQEKEKEILAFLRKYCLSPRGGLIVGASASPDLFNIYTGTVIDKDLGNLCEKYKIIYTRYSDDLTFSSNMPIGKKKRKAIRKIIKEAGFEINHRKSAVYDLRKGPITINGVGLKFGGRIFLPRHFLRKINGMINEAARGKIEPSKIHGTIGIFKQLTPRHERNKTELKLMKKYHEFCQQIT